MARSPYEDFSGSFLGLVIIALCLAFAVIITPFFLLGAAAYVGFRLYNESPRRLEQRARDETMVLYNHALSGRVQVSPDEIDAAVMRSWPPDTPEALRIQLLEIGRAIYADEGLAPEVPPPPALCNTVEGARYRDQLARLGQARGDRVMAITALEMISESLGSIARAVPPLSGDVMVGVTQFLHPLGQAVERAVAPFFADNQYRHFQTLRERLDANLERTHRTSP